VQVCKSWLTAVDAGVQNLQSDNKWSTDQFSLAVNKFAGVTKLDLQVSQIHVVCFTASCRRLPWAQREGGG